MGYVKKYDNFPVWVVILTNLSSLSIYGFGFFILYRLGLIFSLLYLVYVCILEFRLIKHHCVDCYYWGKTCGFGKGRISSLLFKQGDSLRFCSKPISWKNMIPDLMVTLIPFFTGIILLINKFDLLVLAALILIFVLSTFVNGLIRGHLTCKYCYQKELGCPADKFFSKE